MLDKDFLIFIACAIAWIMVLLPSIVYLGTEWRSRRDRLLGALDDESLILYFKRFFPSKAVSTSTVRTQFKKDFHRLYGLRQYLIPLILLAAVSAVGLLLVHIKIRSWLGLSDESIPIPPIVIASFLGAYAWVLLDQLSRYQRRDFTKHNVYDGVFRFLVSVPIGISFAALFREEIGVPLAFLLGSFPTQTLMKFSRRLVVERMGLGENEKDGPTELAKLQGIGRENAERFQHIDITTIPQLAWADPIDLTIRTNFEFNFLIDTISQALMWVYFEDDSRKLYALSLRGSQEVNWLFRALKSDDRSHREYAEKIFEDAAKALKMDSDSFMHTLRGVSEDPYTEFIVSIWAPDKQRKKPEKRQEQPLDGQNELPKA